MATLALRGLKKNFGDVQAVRGISLDTADGEMIALLGGSGCGKTTTLRMIAGFLEPDDGTILVNGRDIGKIPAYKRNIGIFFQNYALFPHMNVFENVAFGLKIRHLPKAEVRKRVLSMLELVKLVGLDKRYPRELSGGQQQRVALARALVTRPEILLLDEPLSNLDAKLRVEMQVEIKRIQKSLGITTIIVTHDHEEAVSLADRVVVMHAGEILQIGTPQQVFETPVSPFVADFMGFSTFLRGRVDEIDGDAATVRCGESRVLVKRERLGALQAGQPCMLAVRAENLRLARAEDTQNVFEGRVVSSTYRGNTTRLEVEGCFQEPIFISVNGYLMCEKETPLRVCISPEHICVYTIPSEESKN